MKESVAGGQVNCPKCQKLILIPNVSPFGELDDPFNAEAVHKGGAVARAVAACVDPYRKELEAKTELLNDAVEMVKTRNARIREVESLLLRVQKDLWALEVGYDEEKEDYLRAQADRKRLKQHIEALESNERGLHVVEQRFEQTLGSLAHVHEQIAAMEDRSGSVNEALDMLDALEKQMEGDFDRLGAGDQVLKDMGQVFRDALKLLRKSSERIQALEAEQAELIRKNESLDTRRLELKSLLRDAIDQIEAVK